MKTPSAALIAVALLASCTAQPGSTPSQASVSQPTPAASASSAEPIALEDIEPGTSLQAGTYTLHYGSIGGEDQFPTLAFTFTLPDGWERVRVDGLLWNDRGARLGFAVVDNLYADPCDPGRGVQTPPVGPSVDDLTAALLAVPGWENAVVTEDAFYGFGGQGVELTAETSCQGEESKLFHTFGSPGYALAPDVGDRYELRILNVEGTRCVIFGIATQDAAPAIREELRAVLDSIQIQP